MPADSSSPLLISEQATDASAGDDQIAIRRQRRNRAFANGLLGSMAAIVVGTHWVDNPGFATLLVRSGAEAGLVGGLADWFAVTALFRHPLGVPIPHTAIIPNSRDRIAATLGRFIERHFLTADTVLAKLRSVGVGRRFATWIALPSSADAIADTIVDALPYLIRSAGSPDLLNFAHRTLGEQLRQADFTPVLGRVLHALTVSGEADVVFDRAIQVAEKLLQENSGQIEKLVQERSRWWIPKAIDRRIAAALISGVIEVLHKLQEPEGDARLKFRKAILDLIHTLQTSPEQREQINAAKNRLLEHPGIQAWLGSIWTELSELALQDLQTPSSKTRASLQHGLSLFGQALATDEAMQKHLDSALERLALYIVTWRSEISSFFSDVVRNWDTKALSDRLELVVGSDLQYIRMNGTIVGALVGCLLYLGTWAIS